MAKIKVKKQEPISVVEIKSTDVIKYRYNHKRFGRAEFILCPVFKRGYMQKLFIYRKQQGESGAFVLDVAKVCPRVSQFMVETWTHKTEAPRIWKNFWCKEHKCISFEVYVPPLTRKMVFNFHFGDTLSIRMES